MDENFLYRGSITVFLSLTFLLILALIGTIIETARIGVSKTYIDRALKQSLDTLFSDYNRELWEDYHLFALQEEKDNEFIEQLKEQMEYTFYPNKDLDILGKDISNLNLFSIKTNTLSIEKKTKLNEYDGKIFINQVTEYMKYKTGEKLIKEFLEKLHLIQSFQKTVEVVKTKLETEESLGILNQDMMEFIEHIEGIRFGKTGIQFTRDGRIKTNFNFVKRYVTTDISQEGVGIYHNDVWTVLKNSYINLTAILEEICSEAKKAEEYINQLKELENQLEQLYSTDTSSMEEDAKESFAQRISDLSKEKTKIEEKIQDILKNVKEKRNIILNSYKDIRDKIEKSLAIIPILEEKQKTILEKVKNYENKLEENKTQMVPDLVEGFERDLEALKAYVGTEISEDGSISKISSMIQMKPLLEENKNIVIKLEDLKEVSIKKDIEDIKHLISVTNELIFYTKQYHTNELSFDYSSLIIKPDRKNPIKLLTSLLKDGILDLVVEDPKNISLKKKQKPIGEETDSFILGEDLEKGLKKAPEEGYSKEITDVFKEYSSEMDCNKFLSETANKMAEKLLLIEYILEHFRDYSTDYKKEANWDKTALDYEKEYFAAGKLIDKENLAKVVIAIVVIRTIINYIYLLSDKEKGTQTYATAAALVGFTGLEPLVRLTQQLIFLTWAFEEALVDMTALLQGKKLSFVKTENTMNISYNELLSINRDFIQKKASQIPEEQEGLCFYYTDYLRVLLLLQKEKALSNKAMDLIEENFCIRYWDAFSIKQCIFGLKVKGDFYIPSKFIRLPFVQKVLGEKRGSWKIEMIQEHTY